MPTRRQFIRIIGIGGAVTALAAGGTTWALNRGAMPESAIAPWNGPEDTVRDPRLRAAAHALLAPNSHNMQPWLVRLQGDTGLTLHVDLERLLPETDPPGRQILISQGTFLELFRQAAEAEGHAVAIDLLPDGPFPPDRLDDRAVARLTLTPAAPKPDPLFAQLRRRRSTKTPFDTGRELDPSALARLGSVIPDDMHFGTLVAAAPRQAMRDLVEAAFRREIETPHTLQESIDRMRIGPAEVATNPDGISLLGPMVWWGSQLGMVNRAEMAVPGSAGFQASLDMGRDQSQTAMGFGWLVTPDNSRLSQLRAGMAYMRLNLKATAEGIAWHPMSQAMQEYPEMDTYRAALWDQAGVAAPAHIQMLVRLGYAKDPGPAPRRAVDAIVTG